jgi:hypothetical protein
LLKYTLVSGDITDRLPIIGSPFIIEVYVVAKTIGLAILLVSFASVASARPFSHLFCQPDSRQDQHTNSCGVIGEPTTTPEIDPASAMAGLTLLMGGLAVLRGRRAGNPAAL